MYAKCPYNCDNKTCLGYCKTTVCINPERNRVIYDVHTTISEHRSVTHYSVPNDRESKMLEDPDYGRWVLHYQST